MSGPRRRFRFIKEIAEGGFGKVYLAEQMSSDGFSRIVAVKLLHAKWSSHDEVVMRTRDEARLLGLIRHQHIVKVEDLTSIDGKCAIVMEYLEGVDLKGVMGYLREKNEVFPREALFECMLGVCSALDAAYNGLPLQGDQPLRVIHRDIKPSNIFVTVPGAVKVLDFGTARANFAEREAKTQALAFGSQGYMAPERMLGEEDTPKADIFSLGVTLYELLTGESFGRIPPRPNKFLAKVQERVAALPLTGDAEWQQSVRETVRSMLAYEPAERPTAAQLVDTFELLAQNAKDTGLRKFCRTTVAEAKAHEPELQSGDPLTGKTVDEDVSTAFNRVEGIPDMNDEEAGNETIPPEGPQTSGPKAKPPAKPASTPPPAAPRQASLPPTTKNSTPPTTSPAADASDDEPPASGGMGKIIVGVGALVVVGVILFGLVAVAIGGVVVFGGPSTDTTPPTDTKVVDTKPPPTSDGPTGGVIKSKDDRKDVARSPTVLHVTGAPNGADVTIEGGVGFKAEWDGKAAFDLGDMAEGKYRTLVTPTGADKIRGKSFDVVGKKKCDFTFDVAGQSWTGGCK